MTNTPPVGSDAERTEFETWILTQGGSVDRVAPGEYRSAPTECAWTAWQAARALPALPEPGMRVVPVEPTEAMLDAAGESIYGYPRDKAEEWAKTEKFESCAQVGLEAYRAMLAAAPTRLAVGDGREPLSEEQKSDCGEAGHAEGRCGNGPCLGSAP